MEFFRPLQRQLGNGARRQGAWMWDSQLRSWNTLHTFQGQQTAFLHRSSRIWRANDVISRIRNMGRGRNVRWQSNKPPSPNPTEHLGSPEPQTLSARMRKLSREYGWSALGVYLGLSALDFPFCFLAVRWLGTDRIGRWEHAVIETFWMGAEMVYPGARAKKETVLGDSEREGWGVEEANANAKSESATLWTQLVLAYAIHKSFIFIRVPLTAAITPKVVKTLRSWGINIGKRKPKA